MTDQDRHSFREDGNSMLLEQKLTNNEVVREPFGIESERQSLMYSQEKPDNNIPRSILLQPCNKIYIE